MSALPIDASQAADAPGLPVYGCRPDSRQRRPGLAVVSGAAVSARSVPGQAGSARTVSAKAVSAKAVPVRAVPVKAVPRAVPVRAVPVKPVPVKAVPVAAGPAPLRLTRRGRLVVGAALAIAAAASASLVILTASAGAQASDHGQGSGGYAGMREIVVRPGQTLWSIAAGAEPSADPRVVIQQIMSVNSLSSTQIQAGELLWVPR
jgi:hypothetical protein